MRYIIIVLLAAFALTLPAAPALAADTVSGLAKADPQPADGALKPGLAVTYFHGVFNDTREIDEWKRLGRGVKGEPILVLDYNVGDGEVLTSGRVDEVGADINGFIRFDQAGTYTMAMQSNDGVVLTIGGQIIVKDTVVHADRFSDLIPVEIAEPGWYPLHLLYFEKRNTSTVELYWKPPGEETIMDFVPPEALAHVPE